MKITHENKNYELDVKQAIYDGYCTEIKDTRFFPGGVYKRYGVTIIVVQQNYAEDLYYFLGNSGSIHTPYSDDSLTAENVQKKLNTGWELIGILPNLKDIKLTPPPAL